MPKDESSKSRSFAPYNTQDGRRGVSRAGPGSRTGPLEPRLPAPQLSSAHGFLWTQYPPPTYSNSSIHPTEITDLFQRAPTGSQPQPQSEPMVNVVDQTPPSEKPRRESRDPEGINFGTISSVYDVYAQVPPSCFPHPPVATYPIFDRSASAGWVQDSGAITMSRLPLPPTLAAPPAPPAQLSIEHPSRLGSGSMPESPLSFMYNPYSQPSAFDLSGVLPDPSFTLSSCLEWMEDQFLQYPDIDPDPQPPAAPIFDIPPESSSFEWTAKDLELLFNPSLLTLTQVSSASLSSTQPTSEAQVSLQLPPHSSYTSVLPNPQDQSSQVLNCGQPAHDVEARESLPPNSYVGNKRSSTSLFRNAQNFRTGDWHVNNTVVTSGKIDGWKILQEHAAPNALHNSSARYDAPKCDEDTRVEVTAEIMEWIKDRAHPQRLLCMTGAAGAGKSALQQSIAECCAEDNILGGAYFISNADLSRNTAATIVPTIAYQLGLNHPVIQSSVAAEVERDPFVFSRSLETQMNALIVRPFEGFRERREPADVATFPFAILIDGLDECQGERTPGLDNSNTAVKRRAEDRQAELLSAIRNCLLKQDLPFRIFIASRPEWAIHTALGTGGSLHGLAYHIPLSDKYDATEDMRRYLRRRFEDIGLRIGQPHWFTEGDIDTLVQAGSGQFVYVATVYKYVSERRASPVQRLKTVLNWTPEQAARPFEALDMLYRNILLNAKEAYEDVDTHSGRDFLLLLKIYLLDLTSAGPSGYGPSPGSDTVTALLHLERDALEVLTLDLRSLVYFEEVQDEPGFWYLAAYHKSLYDFIDEKSRAKDLFVPLASICTHLAKCGMQRIVEAPEPELYTPNLVDWTDRSASPSRRCLSFAIGNVLLYFSEANIDDEIIDFTHKGGWDKIDTVLYEPSGFNVIFVRFWNDLRSVAKYLKSAADVLKKRRPDSEAGAIMHKYAQNWEDLAYEKRDLLDCESGFDTDSSEESNDESSNSDSD